MASKRRQRRRSCKSKIRHDSEENAWIHAHHLGVAYHPYRCQFCGGWHVGRLAKEKVRGLLVKAENRRHNGEKT
jgi:hypothetical protein